MNFSFLSQKSENLKKNSQVKPRELNREEAISPVDPTPKEEILPIRVYETTDALGNISKECFSDAALVLAFVSPHVDFSQVSQRLKQLVSPARLIAITTAGELSACVDKTQRTSLYKETGESWSSVVVQVFSKDVFKAVSVHSTPLHNEDIKKGKILHSDEERTALILKDLERISLPFKIDAKDTVALTFIEGISACENCFMRAVYKSGRFPCLFVGGSAAGKLDLSGTNIFDGTQILQDHAVSIFLKLQDGKRYGVLKSQNVEKTDKKFFIVEACPETRTVSSVYDEFTGEVRPFANVVAEAIGTTVDKLKEEIFSNYSFAVEIDGEIFTRSASKLDEETGQITLFCDVNVGDVLHLMKATDFAEQTKKDVKTFLSGKPKPLGAILSDCTMRRRNNKESLSSLDNVWNMPAAGFSTFGELFGININQTLTALVFFDDPKETFRDDFVDNFPIHYARFYSYFTESNLSRIVLLNKLRTRTISKLMKFYEESTHFNDTVEKAVDEVTSIRAMVGSVYSVVLETDEETTAQNQDKDSLKDEFEKINEGMEGLQGILEIIDRIAGQTNLLALNATIEAARAGEAGRGFSVVATEVKKLAQETKDSLEDTHQSMDKMTLSLEVLGGHINQTGSSSHEEAKPKDILAEKINDMMSVFQRVEESLTNLKNLAITQKGSFEQMKKEVDFMKTLD